MERKWLCKTRTRLFLLTLAIGLGGVVALVDDEVLWPVVFAAGEVRLEDGLGAGSVSLEYVSMSNSVDSGGTYLLGINRSTGHVRNHSVASAPWVLGISERVVLRGGLREPDITAVSTEVARLERLSDILLDNDGATGGVDEPGA